MFRGLENSTTETQKNSFLNNQTIKSQEGAFIRPQAIQFQDSTTFTKMSMKKRPSHQSKNTNAPLPKTPNMAYQKTVFAQESRTGIMKKASVNLNTIFANQE
jgi:hypothetical protein